MSAAAALRERALALLGQRRPAEAEALLRELLSSVPQDAEAWDGLGRALNNLGRPPEALEAFERAIALAPGEPRFLDHRGHVLRALDRLPEAEAAFRAALSSDPDYLPARDRLAALLAASARPGEALAELERAAALAPGDPLRETNLGDLLRASDRHEEAATAYERALASRPEAVEAWAGLGAARQATGRFRAAMEAYGEALRLSPAHPVAAPGMAALLELEGRAAEGLSLIESQLAGRTVREAVAVTAARLLHRLGRGEEALDVLARAPDGPSPSPRRRYVLAQVLDGLGRHEEAFRAAGEANRLAGSRFDPAAFEATVAALVEFFTPARLERLARSAVVSDAPVFIVGMPRSGTSLVEQMLAAHPDVLAMGERTALFEAVRTLSGGDPGQRWPAALADASSGQLDALAADWLAPLGRSPALRLTDKLPTNFVNLALVQLMLPGARVVWCRRDALDCGLSCYFQDFQSPGMAFTRDLAHIGAYMRACRRLMRHWQATLALPVHELDYEALVGDPTGELARLLAFLDLPWEPACLDFHRLERTVNTASFDQVRRPLYASSVGRHASYRRWLGPLAAALGPDFRW